MPSSIVCDDVKASRTVSADEPWRSNRSISLSAKSSPSPRDTTAEYTMSSGISALNACAARATARSTPCTAKKRSAHDRANCTAGAIIDDSLVRARVRPLHPFRVTSDHPGRP